MSRAAVSRKPVIATTDGIRVEATARMVPASTARSFLATHAEKAVSLYSYRIRITNQSPAAARLLERHWVILDADGERRDVAGSGVIGQQPHLQPGETFVYDSFCPLPTDWGTMEGTYTFEREGGAKFGVAIPRFFLTPPPQPAATEA